MLATTSVAFDMLIEWEKGHWTREVTLNAAHDSPYVDNDEFGILEYLTDEDEFSEGEGEEVTGLGTDPTDPESWIGSWVRSGKDRRDGRVGCRRKANRRVKDRVSILNRVQESGEVHGDLPSPGASLVSFGHEASSIPEDESS